MVAYLWHDIKRCSGHYHPEGSVLIVAPTLTRARELAVFKDIDGETAKMDIERSPDAVFKSDYSTEKVWVFPNAGCC